MAKEFLKPSRNLAAAWRADAADALSAAAELTMLAAVSARQAKHGRPNNYNFYISRIRNLLSNARVSRGCSELRGFRLPA